MKYYLARYTQYDGEHEHLCRLLIKAENEEQAIKSAKKEEYNCDDDTSNEEGENYKFFSYGDNQTAVRFSYLDEITEQEAKVLIKVNAISTQWWDKD